MGIYVCRLVKFLIIRKAFEVFVPLIKCRLNLKILDWIKIKTCFVLLQWIPTSTFVLRKQARTVCLSDLSSSDMSRLHTLLLHLHNSVWCLHWADKQTLNPSALRITHLPFFCLSCVSAVCVLYTQTVASREWREVSVSVCGIETELPHHSSNGD